MGRKQAREGAMKVLYQMESTKDFSEESLEIYLENFKYDKGETEYIRDSIKNIRENLDRVDEKISVNLEDWSISRLAKVDLSILRVAIYEIMYRSDIPVEVSINEAIETAKRYSAKDSYKFINGVLGGFVRSLDK